MCIKYIYAMYFVYLFICVVCERCIDDVLRVYIYIYINIYKYIRNYVYVCVCERDIYVYMYIYIYIYTYIDVVMRCVTCTGWRRFIGCLKLHVAFHKKTTKYKALLWKLSYREKTSYAFSPPYFLFKSLFVYGVATCSRLLKIIGLLCKRAL